MKPFTIAKTALLLSLSLNTAPAAQYAAIWEQLPWKGLHGLTANDYQYRFNDYTTQDYRPIDVSGHGLNGVGYYAAAWEKNDGRPWQARHGVSAANYQGQFDQLASQGFRPVRVNGFEVGGNIYYNTVWEPNDGRGWVARHGLNATDYQAAFNTYVSQGYRLVDVSGYTVNNVTYYAAIWDNEPGPAWAAHHGLNSADYQWYFNYYLSLGYRLAKVSGYEVAGVDYYAAIWEQNDGRAWMAHHGLSATDYQNYFNQYYGQGYRLVRVCGYKVGSASKYAAIWEKGSGGAPWVSHHGLTSSQYQNYFSHYVGQGYRLVHVSGCAINGADYYAGLWERRPTPAWVSHHGITSQQYSSLFASYANLGYRLTHVNGFGVNGVAYFAAIWEMNDGRVWAADHDLTAADYQTRFTQRTAAGFRLVKVCGYVVNDVAYYAAIWEQRGGPAWVSYNRMNASEYAARFAQYASTGYRLSDVSGYAINGVPFYAAIWEQTDGRPWVAEHGLSDGGYSSLFSHYVNQGYRLRMVNGYAVSADPVPDVPTSGVPVPELAAFDDAMKRFVASHRIPAAVICVSRNGSIKLERAYGYQDAAGTVPLKPSALFRTASLAKPITAAAIQKLATAGRLSLTAKVFNVGQPGGGLLSITPFGTADTRLRDITVTHLLEHKGGWDRAKSGDPMFQTVTIAAALNVSNPPSQRDIVRYMMGRPLDFTPGATNAYSNFGYLLLGLIIEQVTGEDYVAYIQREIFNPHGAANTEVQWARSLPENRNPREPWYSDPFTGPNVFDPAKTVPMPDGGFYAEAMEAHGGLISSARAYVQFMHGYWLNGQPRSGNGQDWLFYGSLPGTYAMGRQRSDGVNIAVFFNQRQGENYSIIKDVMDSAAASITTWPDTDMVKVRPVSPWIRMQAATRSMQLMTEAGRVYQVEASTDLSRWVELGSPVVGDGAEMNVSLPMADSSVTDRLFFRLRVE